MDSFREEYVRSRGKIWRELGYLLHNLSEEYGYLDYETFEQEVMLTDMSFEEAGMEKSFVYSISLMCCLNSSSRLPGEGS